MIEVRLYLRDWLRRPLGEIAGLFVLSLVPIAIAYHLAHYLSYLLVAGQLVIPIASDPFGLGWNLFASAGYKTDIAIIGAKTVWYTAVIAIVLGHVFAVWVAHIVALQVFDGARRALQSQYPFLVLMVLYTMVSLWILAQPIVANPSLSQLGGPVAERDLAPFEFREFCLELAAGERIEVDFRADRRVDFDIHYHDGLAIHYPVKIERIANHKGQFIAETARSYCLTWFNPGLAPAALSYRIDGP